MKRSFQLLRTNPKLTTNMKIVVDSKYNLYFESFDSSRELSTTVFKHYVLNKEAIIENEVPKFYMDLPKSIAFLNKENKDVDIMYDEYALQFDDTYYCGASQVEDQWYKEEFEYFAPLHIKKNEFPEKFIILRIDEPNIYQKDGSEQIIGNLNNQNFREEIIDKWKCVKVFDLTNSTNVGKFIDRNINNNKRFPEYSLFFDAKPYNYSKWSGIDYNSGVYRTSEMFLDDKLYYSNPHFNLEEFITDGFRENSLIYPYILNFKFLFDDKPGTPSTMNNWSMNRYYGFYVDQLEQVDTITSFKLSEIKENIKIKNNIFLDNNDNYINPFVIGSNNNWIQVDNNFYEVKQQSSGAYKIITDKNLSGYNTSQFKTGDNKISNNQIFNVNLIDPYLNEDDENESLDLYADIYLIEIDNQYHILKNDNDKYYIHTDYAINSNNQILEYWKGGPDSKYYTSKKILNDDGSPISYKIFRVKLLDIKDFDFDRIHTNYSDFDYEKSEYYDTPETKLYATEYRDNSKPKRWKTHDKSEDGQYQLMNISSEYSACDETFQLKNNILTPIFEKTQTVCKWMYNDSISHSDYPYKLNNNTKCGGKYNRTTNTDLNVANAKEKNLDYFYRIGEFFGEDNERFIDGFDEDTFEDKWSGDTSIWDISLQPNDLHVSVSETTGPPLYQPKSVYLEYKKDIEIDQLYKVEFIAEVFSPINTYALLGVNIESFDYLTYVNINDGEKNHLNFSIIGKSKSNKLSLVARHITALITDFKLTKIVDKFYLNQSTNIQTKLISKSNKFNLNEYIDSKVDYFDYFFKNNMIYEDSGKQYKKPYQKYSIFNGGDEELPATTLFKGIEYKIYNVEDVVLNPIVGNDETIRNIITKGGKNFNGYKFSTILSERYHYYKFDKEKDGEGNIIYTNPEKTNDINTSIAGFNNLFDFDTDGIHIFLNKKYKNILVIINKIIPFNLDWRSLNNVDEFKENYGLYYGKNIDDYSLYPQSGNTNAYNPNDLTASNFINSLNNLNEKPMYSSYVSYYLIDEDGSFAKTNMINFNDSNHSHSFLDIENWENKYPNFYMETDTPNTITMKTNSYIVKPIKGPATNIYDKYYVYSDNRPLTNSYIDQPLARKILKIEEDNTKKIHYHGERIKNIDEVYRFVGYYEPIFKNIPIFKNTYYWKDIEKDEYGSFNGNYVFNDDLKHFGIIDEVMYSKVNETGNFLKLKDSDNDLSHYPMIDEVGLSQTNRFIFMSNWDKEFYIKTLNEQTFLENFVQTPISKVDDVISVEIQNSTITGGFDSGGTYYNGIKVYAKDYNPFGPNKVLNYQVTIKNTGNISEEFEFRMYFTSSITTDTIHSGATGMLEPSESITIDFEAVRPSEDKSTPLEAYTNWGITYEAWSKTDPTINSTRTFNSINVWNDVIDFSLSNPVYEPEKSESHYIGNEYDFQITLSESSKKGNNLYNFNLYVDKYPGTSIPAVYKLLGEKTYTSLGGFTDNIPNINVLLDNNLLEVPTGETYYARIKFELIYEYEIEGTTIDITEDFEDSGYKIVRSPFVNRT